MSESGGFGGGFSDGGASSSGGTGGSFFSGGVGPSESGTFGYASDWDTRNSNHSFPFLPAIGGGVIGYMVGRNSGGSPPMYPSSVPGYQYPSAYSPIIPGSAAQYSGAPPPVVVQYQPGPITRHRAPVDPMQHRKNLMWWGFVVAAILAFFLYFFIFASQSVELRDREEHLLTASSWFVSALTIYPSSSWLAQGTPELARLVSFQTSVYTFASRPSPTKLDQFQLGQRRVVVPRRGFQAWPVWLNRGSTVQVNYSVPAGPPLELYVIRGRSEMESWKDNPTAKGNDGVLLESVIRGPGSRTFRVRRDGLYFFSLANFDRAPVTCDLLLSVSSTLYDLGLGSYSCDLSTAASPPCSVDLPFGAPQYAVLSTSEGSDPHRPSRVVRVSYEPRALAYVLLLASPWLLFALFAVLDKLHSGVLRNSGARISESLHSAGPPTGDVNPRAPAATWQQQSGPAHPVGSVAADVSSAKAPIPETWLASRGTVATAALGEVMAPGAPSAPMLEDELAIAGKDEAGHCTHHDSACSVCMEKPKDSVILDCGHRATCFSCAQMLQSSKNPLCPICRRPIRQVTRVFDV